MTPIQYSTTPPRNCGRSLKSSCVYPSDGFSNQARARIARFTDEVHSAIVGETCEANGRTSRVSQGELNERAEVCIIIADVKPTARPGATALPKTVAPLRSSSA